MSDPWAQTAEECFKHYGVKEKTGLSSSQVQEALARFGHNELQKEEPTPLWQLVLDQFKDKLVLILLGSALLSFVLAFFEEHGELTAFVEPFVILLILIINAIVGVWQEHNAENALEALKELQSTHARCLRNGKWDHDLDARNLVPGDIVEVRVGDKVPADCRLLRLKTTTFRTDEGSLTGESATVLKHTDPVLANVKIQDKKNMIFSGTTVSGGTVIAIVVRTGMQTEIGRIQQDVQAAKEDEEKTPLGQKLDAFSDLLANIIGVICLLVWVMNFNSFNDPIHGGTIKGMIYYLKIAVALGVAAIPEGLPAVITLCLALGTRKMVRRNAIVRKLPSVETLGCCTVICSDKTGTLTTNQMTAVALVHLDSSEQIVEHDVQGTGYSPQGSVDQLGLSESTTGLMEYARVCTLCNEAEVFYKDGKYGKVGEPTEAALKVLVEKIGYPGLIPPTDQDLACKISNEHWATGYENVATLEFSRDRKSMSVICSTPSNTNALFCKGAPESVVPRCTHMMLEDGTVLPLQTHHSEKIMAKVLEMARRPLRCLAFAEKLELGSLADYDGPHHPAHKELINPEDFKKVEENMVFLGLVGIKDPARAEVAPAIEQCHNAGIRVIMITGDNKDTAEAIAKEIGIFSPDEDLSEKSFTGAQFFAHPPAERTRLLMQGGGSRAFSRTEPRDKQALVKLLREQDEVPAMTGDGVNDAPALKQAAIGIAMGISGTEVAKEASDMVLADDNFATIVHAVEEGRSIYSNMKAFIRYLISSNIGEVASIFFTALLGLPEGLIPVQLLWVNLVTDGPPATALGFNPPDDDIMMNPPRRKDDKLISAWVFFRYMVIGIYVGFATVGVFVVWYLYDYSQDGHTTISFYQLSHWSKCPHWEDFTVAPHKGVTFSNPCHYFSEGKKTASTLSLSVLVTIEMFNALNALSEDGSLLHMPPWANPYLLLAMALSFGLHFLILYVPLLASIFSIVPLTGDDWMLVLVFSFPVILIDEVLKFIGRVHSAKERRNRLKLEAHDKKEA
eukprot:NODE_96_length_3230_cov_94.267161_g89_i0.p1 GENE.NODE_96_length_3230_cov_94.267161_g89_i0~~NODE_96_length_3230_cov_94.267161_g89_i0.p1  ORF type:complete len:1019 (-),score=234.18 NODE_96_length_3230_cov_94.267161_g89_i0:99-3155(-)